MKKIIAIVIIVLLTIFGFWYAKKMPSKLADSSVATYRNSGLGISFTYPKILSASTTGEIVSLHHEVLFEHHDYCDFKGEATTTIPSLTDFQVSFRTQDKNIVDTIKTESPYIPEENFVNGNVVPSPGFIDSVTAGSLEGYKIFEGAEGCGHTTYYFSVSNSKTLIVKEDLITVFTGAIDKENEDAALAVPGVINKEKETEILNSILKTVQVN